MFIPFVGCRAPSGWRCGTLGAMDNDPTPDHPLLARLDALVASLHAQTEAIEALVAVAAASLPDEPPGPDDGFPQPLGRPR